MEKILYRIVAKCGRCHEPNHEAGVLKRRALQPKLDTDANPVYSNQLTITGSSLRRGAPHTSMTWTLSVAGDPTRAGRGWRTILDALLRHGVGFAYSCQAGNCGTCRCEWDVGRIPRTEYSQHALSPGERERGVIPRLPCPGMGRRESGD